MEDILKHQKVSPRRSTRLPQNNVDTTYATTKLFQDNSISPYKKLGKSNASGINAKKVFKGVVAGAVILPILLALGKCEIEKMKVLDRQMQEYYKFEWFYKNKLHRKIGEETEEDVQRSWENFIKDKALQDQISQEMGLTPKTEVTK